jgi:methyl-accepting chemotaxis protein
MMKRGIAAAATLLCALTLSACGGDDEDKTLSPSAWADTLCTDLDQWQSSLQSVRASFGGNVTPENAQDAADQVGDATETLVGDLQDLGTPDTEAGQQARDDVDQLSDELEKGSNEIQRAADAVSSASDLPQAAATIAATTREVATELASTLTKLEQLDPQGELASALEQSPACKDLKTTGR